MSLAFVTRKLRSKIRKVSGVKKNSRLHRVFGVAVTFTFVTVAWTFFKAAHLPDAFYIVARFFSGAVAFFVKTVEFLVPLAIDLLPAFLLSSRLQVLNIHLLVVMGAFFFLLAWEILQRKQQTIAATFKVQPVWLRWPLYYVIIFWVLIFGQFGTQQFIYFRF